MAVKRYDGSQWVTVAGKGDQGTSSSIATWVKTATGGETSVSGNDDNSQPLSYTVGQELVFINGALQKRGADYTATTGNSITGLTALAANDVVTVWTVNAFSVTNAISNTLVDAKGDLIVATGADTPGRLAVGSNGQVLTAASTTGTGLAWSAPQSMTLLSTTTLSGGTVSITDISGSYKRLIAFIYGVTNATANGVFRVAPNNNTTGSSYVLIDSVGASFVNSVNRVTQINFGTTAYSRTSSNNAATLIIDNYANSTNYKPFSLYGFAEETGGSVMSFHGGGAFVSNTAITRLDFQNSQGNLLTGTVLLYGVN